MTAKEILEKLKSFGSDQTKKIYLRHGAWEPVYGVKVEDMKKLTKGVKGNNAVAAELFASGVCDAMYLAGLIADGSKMTPEEIDGWASQGYGFWIGEFSIPWVASENEAAMELALKWVDSPNERVSATGWATLSSIVSTWPDEDLDTEQLRKMLHRAEKEIHGAPDRVRYVMNGFIIAAGSFVTALTDECLAVGARIGKVKVIMEGTACKVPVVAETIEKVKKAGRLGRKRTQAKC